MSAVTGLKRLCLAVCVLIVGLFGALAVVSFLIPKDQVREAVKAEIRNVTGLDPDLRGGVSVSLFPYGQVELWDVALGDNAGEPPLQASRVVARLSFLPLVLGQIEIADITLADPRIVVTVDAQGKSNWSPLLNSLTRAFDTKGRRDRDDDDVPSFSEIRINSGTFVVRDDYRGIYEYVSGADLSLAWPAISRSFAVTGTARYRGEMLDIGVTLGNFAAALQGDRSALKVRVAGEPLKFAFDGSMAAHPTMKIEGTTSIDSPSLRRAIAWMGRKPLPGGGLEHFSLKAQTNVLGGTIALSQVNLEVDGNSAEGVLTFAADGRQTLQGTLAADAIDLTTYLSTVRLLAAPDREWSRTPIDLDGLTTADLDLRLSAGKITIGSAQLGRTAIATNLRGGKLGITIGEARGFGGVIRGNISLAKADQGAAFASQMVFDNVNLERCIGELFGIRRINAKGTLTVAVEGAGPSVYALTRTLDGDATLTANKGSLTGLNIESLLQRLERRPLSSGSEFRSGQTPFETLSAELKIVKGKATVQTVDLRGQRVQLAIAGEASIPARDLDLKGVATLVSANADRKSFELPFVVQGPWDDPLMLPDAQILIQRSGAAAPLLEALRGRGSASAPAAAPALQTPDLQQQPSGQGPAVPGPGAANEAPARATKEAASDQDATSSTAPRASLPKAGMEPTAPVLPLPAIEPSPALDD